jgi:hypothetical protein
MNGSLPSPPVENGLPGSEASPPVPTDIFDATRARWPTRRVRVADIIDLLQVTHASDRIGDYAAAMRRGERLPPIAVFGRFGFWFVADGHKRLSAYRQFGQPWVLVECWPLGALLADLLRQAGKSWRRICAALAALPEDRQPAGLLLAHTLAHWSRLGRSLVCLLLRRRPYES